MPVFILQIVRPSGDRGKLIIVSNEARQEALSHTSKGD